MLRSTKIWVLDGIIAFKIALDRMMITFLVVSTEVVGSPLLMFYAASRKMHIKRSASKVGE